MEPQFSSVTIGQVELKTVGGMFWAWLTSQSMTLIGHFKITIMEPTQ